MASNDTSTDDLAKYSSITARGTATAYRTPKLADVLPEWTDLADLASSNFNAQVVYATDEWFAGCDCLIHPDPPVFVDTEFSSFGKWMDGWESRRKRIPGNDWCIIKLGYPGIIRGFIVDTAHFTGNQVPAFSIRGVSLASDDAKMKSLAAMRTPCFNGGKCQGADPLTATAAAALNSQDWKVLVSKQPLEPGYEETRRHLIEVGPEIKQGAGLTHIRLDMFPDGGIARLRAFGEVVRPDILRGDMLDLIAASNGGVPVGCSNKHYGTPANLIAPGRAATMGEGWETARNPSRPAVLEAQPDGKLKLPAAMTDWAIIKLATVGVVERMEIDTNHFKGNCPESCTVEGLFLKKGESSPNTLALNQKDEWKTVLKRVKLQPHTRHYFEVGELEPAAAISHLKITIFPDGGISRLRVYGKPVAAAASL